MLIIIPLRLTAAGPLPLALKRYPRIKPHSSSAASSDKYPPAAVPTIPPQIKKADTAIKHLIYDISYVSG